MNEPSIRVRQSRTADAERALLWALGAGLIAAWRLGNLELADRYAVAIAHMVRGVAA